MVVLNFGYVETSSLSKVFFVHQDGYFETKEDAVSHLAMSLLYVYLKEQDYAINGWRSNCCAEAAKNEDYAWCPKCRMPLRMNFSFDSFERWVNGFPGLDADGAPNFDDYCCWWPWVTWKEAVQLVNRTVEITELAAQTLTATLKLEDLEKYKEIEALDVDEIRKAWKEWAWGKQLDLFKSAIV
jgi:hypothetical protein